METVDLTALLAEVGRRAAGSPLDQIEAALAVSDELEAGADELVGHAVTQARQAGCSWTEIGVRLGVSKQAARQRFTAQRFTGQRFTGERFTSQPAAPSELTEPRLRACLRAAFGAAAADGAAEVGTHHQLVGLFEEGTAAAMMEKIGLRRDVVRQAARELFPPAEAAGPREPADLRESAEARDAVTGAARLARLAGCGYVGTEHLLAALVLDPGSRARRVLIQLHASIPAIKRELECYIRPRRRRRRGKSSAQQCSFCGKAEDSGSEMVAGPAVRICAECVALASEILAERAGHGSGAVWSALEGT
jgi:ClpX C4-type zinc finger/Clp amino terminal domain, pathogenicity island component